MASSLILHKRITTTVAKAKALRKYVEPLLTKSKTDTTHSRRVVFSYLQNKESVKELFDDVSDKIAARPGGYTRIIKTGNRLGDNAEMCIIELVDYNELMLEEKESKKGRTRRSRRGKKSTAQADKTKTSGAAEQKEKKEESEKKAEEPGEKEADEVKAGSPKDEVQAEKKEEKDKPADVEQKEPESDKGKKEEKK